MAGAFVGWRKLKKAAIVHVFGYIFGRIYSKNSSDYLIAAARSVFE